MTGKIKFTQVGGIVLAVLSLFTLPLASVWKKSRTAELLKEVEGLRADVRSVRLSNLALRSRRDRMLSRERVEAVALEELRMVYPSLADVVVLQAGLTRGKLSGTEDAE